jgi:hypothetical protein
VLVLLIHGLYGVIGGASRSTTWKDPDTDTLSFVIIIIDPALSTVKSPSNLRSKDQVLMIMGDTSKRIRSPSHITHVPREQEYILVSHCQNSFPHPEILTSRRLNFTKETHGTQKISPMCRSGASLCYVVHWVQSQVTSVFTVSAFLSNNSNSGCDVIIFDQL